ncbi:MAG: hypothetical protein ACI9NN_001922, partial [Bacteroidia bacterium]
VRIAFTSMAVLQFGQLIWEEVDMIQKYVVSKVYKTAQTDFHQWLCTSDI